MYSALIIDSDEVHANELSIALRFRNVAVQVMSSPEEAIQLLRTRTCTPHLIIINVTNSSHPWLRLLRELRTAQGGVQANASFFLCISKSRKEVLFELQIEKLGGRFVYEA